MPEQSNPQGSDGISQFIAACSIAMSCLERQMEANHGMATSDKLREVCATYVDIARQKAIAHEVIKSGLERRVGDLESAVKSLIAGVQGIQQTVYSGNGEGQEEVRYPGAR